MSLLTTGKDIKRVNEILSILIRYGLGDMMRRMGLSDLMEQAGRLVRSSADHEFLSMEPPQRVRCAIEEMGPTFVKLGQILATRVDLFEPKWIHEFEKLQDSAPVLPFEDLKPQVERSLGKPIEKVFRTIDETPLASASIAQVHKATTWDGDNVVLKIRKPGCRSKIEADLRLMYYFARLMAIQSEELRRYRPEQIVREFDRSLKRELDFTIEARNAERIGKNLRKLSFVTIPKVYWKWTSEALNVQEFIEGISAKDAQAMDRAKVDRNLIARRGAQIAWKTTLEDGFFHADPHPGNFYILPHNRIAMLDFGMVGKLSRQRRNQLVRLVQAIVLQETENAVAVLMEWTNGEDVDVDALTNESSDLIEQYYGLAISEINIGQLLIDVTALLRNHNIQLPTDISLLAKAFITLEGFGRLVKPDFDMMQEAEPLLRQMMVKRYHPVRLARSLGSRAIKVVDNLYEKPSPISSGRSVSGHQPKPLDPHVFDKLAFRLEDAGYRQTQAIYNMGFLLAFTLLLITDHGPVFKGIHLLNVVGILGVLGTIANVSRMQLVMWWQRKNRDL